MSLPVELFLALRYLRPRRSFVSVITVLSFLGVMLGVMVLIVVLAVMTGFRQRLDDKIIGFNAHLTVAGSGVIYDYDAVVAQVEKDPDVLAASPIIRGPVLVEHDVGAGASKSSNMTPAFIKSVPAEGDDPVLPLRKYLVSGEYELRSDSVIVGAEWARRNFAFPGDEINVYSPGYFHSISELVKKGAATNHVIPLPDTLTIRGIFKTGQFDYDLNFLLVSTETAKHLYAMGDSVQGVAVRLKNPDRAAEVKERLNRILPEGLQARTWMDDNQDLFNAIATERVTMTFILLFVLLVAAFGLCSTLITITVQKSREIGLMKALGATDSQVGGVFLFHSLVVGVFGAAGGTALGLLLLHYRNPFRLFLLNVFHWEVFPGSVYGLPDIPAVVDPAVTAVIATGAIAICVLAALLPALSAARLAPARALRYE